MLEDRTLLSLFTIPQSVFLGNNTAPQSVTSGDFRGNGRLDLAIADHGTNAVSVLLSNGDGTFQAPTSYSLGANLNPTFITSANLNADTNTTTFVTQFDTGGHFVWARALGGPDVPGGGGGVAFGSLDWTAPRALEFEQPDSDAFGCLALAYQAGRAGETAPAWLNAANEVAVAAFLEGVIPWTGIAEINREVLQGYDGTTANSVDVVIEADRRARERARQAVERRAATHP